MEPFISRHLQAIENARAAIMKKICETDNIPVKEIVRLRKEWDDLQTTRDFLLAMRDAVQPSMIVKPGPEAMKIVN